MGNNSKMLAMAMLCVLVMTMASNTLSRMDHRTLAGGDKGDGKSNELEKVASSPPLNSTPIRNIAPTVQNHYSQPPPNQSPPNPKSTPLMDDSTGLLPPPSPESSNPGTIKQGDNNTSRNPPPKEEHQTPEASNKERDKSMQSFNKDPEKEGGESFNKDPEKEEGMTFQAPKEDREGEENKGASNSGSSGDKSKKEICDSASASNVTCWNGVLVACLLQSRIESTEFFLLVQNAGDDDLNVNIKSSSKIKLDSESLNLPKHSIKKVNLLANASRSLTIILKDEKGEDCVLQTKASTSNWRPFDQFPAYAAQFRPMHGAYFFFATIVLFGGTWACCKLGKKEKQADFGIPYRQLEMANQTHSTAAANDEVTGDGWDQNWDDDWEDEEAGVRPATKQPLENVSSNGLSSRAPNLNKDGWEIDWDD